MLRRVLLIEDDPKLGEQVVHGLSGAGFDTRWLREGCLLMANDLQTVELVVLDLMLPGTHGLDVLKHLRTFSDVPVLVLSARNDTRNKVRALQLGADDYMTKPFWPEELIERVHARLRRPVLDRGTVLEVGSLRIDRGRREVSIHRDKIMLTRVEFDFLNALAERNGTAVTRAALVRRIFDVERDSDERTLDSHVSRLRKKLGHAAIIETVWGIGYRLALVRPDSGAS